jgi:hypothetical protein
LAIELWWFFQFGDFVVQGRQMIDIRVLLWGYHLEVWGEYDLVQTLLFADEDSDCGILFGSHIASCAGDCSVKCLRGVVADWPGWILK